MVIIEQRYENLASIINQYRLLPNRSHLLIRSEDIRIAPKKGEPLAINEKLRLPANHMSP